MESAASARNFRASTVHNWPGRDSTDVFTPADYPPRSSAFVFRICLLTNTTKKQGQIEIKTKIQVQIQMQKQLENHICVESLSNSTQLVSFPQFPVLKKNKGIKVTMRQKDLSMFPCFPTVSFYQLLKSSIYSCSLTPRLLANLLLAFLSSQL